MHGHGGGTEGENVAPTLSSNAAGGTEDRLPVGGCPFPHGEHMPQRWAETAPETGGQRLSVVQGVLAGP